MTEDEARDWIFQNFDVPRETLSKLELLEQATIAENARQNLIAPSTISTFWSRHIVDSAQLMAMAPSRGLWIDLGSGAGFPGIVVAILSGRPVWLVEVRKKRAEHLCRLVELLGLDAVEVHQRTSESVQSRNTAALSARAFAPLERLLRLSIHLAQKNTVWVLPKGKSAASELEALAGSWQGEFEIRPSVTDAEAAIIVARDVRPRSRA